MTFVQVWKQNVSVFEHKSKNKISWCLSNLYIIWLAFCVRSAHELQGECNRSTCKPAVIFTMLCLKSSHNLFLLWSALCQKMLLKLDCFFLFILDFYWFFPICCLLLTDWNSSSQNLFFFKEFRFLWFMVHKKAKNFMLLAKYYFKFYPGCIQRYDFCFRNVFFNWMSN